MPYTKKVDHKQDQFHATLKKLRNEANEKEQQLIDLITSVYETAMEKKDKAVEKAKETASSINGSVHTHPWHYIGGAAIGGFLVGILLHRHH